VSAAEGPAGEVRFRRGGEPAVVAFGARRG